MFLEKASQQVFYPPPAIKTLEDPQYQVQAMASEYGMPVQQFTSSPTQSQYTLYNSHSQQTSPINSATATPKTSSPTSPRAGPPAQLPAHTRQLRPLKSPMYVPAVLRPTDHPRKPTRQSPMTPPHSNSNSFDDLDDARSLKRRSTGDSAKFGLGEIQEVEDSIEGLGKVTGFPTREHWKVCQNLGFCYLRERMISIEQHWTRALCVDAARVTGSTSRAAN